MLSRTFLTELKWMSLSLVISLVLVDRLNNGFRLPISGGQATNTFLGLNLFLEILVFFVLSIFVVFGIKAFFERFSQKSANVILLLTGVSLAIAVFILSYQILFQD
ncbi:MAG: hypothetical protein EOO50_15240 [Flavobacterium sp.]|nr:MAG: hypothetical protein EOO50_15240 [Flavobacterium sp.]